MNLNAVPTKGNLIAAKNSLNLAKQGYELMDKKRNILIRELMSLIDEAKYLQSQIKDTFYVAYRNLENANIDMGISRINEIAHAMPVENEIKIKVRSIMGTEIPLVQHEKDNVCPVYSFLNTMESADIARESFINVKELTIKLSMVENAAYRLAMNIKKTQKRANALKNITIPTTEIIIKDITEALEEKEREEFIRLKVIKRNMTKKGGADK